MLYIYAEYGNHLYSWLSKEQHKCQNYQALFILYNMHVIVVAVITVTPISTNTWKIKYVIFF